MTTNSLVPFRSFPCSLVGVKTYPEISESTGFTGEILEAVGVLNTLEVPEEVLE